MGNALASWLLGRGLQEDAWRDLAPHRVADASLGGRAADEPSLARLLAEP